MNPRQEYYRLRGTKLVETLKKRGFQASYASDVSEAEKIVLETIKEGTSVSWGGTMTLSETGILDRIKQGPYTIYDRATANSPEEIEKIYQKALSCDYYLMGTNAITQDGKLVNIDGRGNRLAALIYGPRHVIVVVGMNKLTMNEEEALSRIRNEASPINALRLNRNTPCTTTGVCSDCLSPDCICSHTVITRRSAPSGRIIVILVGQELGY